MMSEEDVIKELDVYLSKALAENLYMFQYLIRPSFISYDAVQNIDARVKPKQEKIEIEIPLNVHSSNYDQSIGEQIAFNVDGEHSTEKAHFKSHLMDKHVLTSTKAGVPSTVRYAACVFREDEVHITPLHSILQLRPSFSYLDRSDALAKKSLEKEDEDDNIETAEPVTARFAGPNAEKAKKAREKSFKYLQQKSESEPWQSAVFSPYGSRYSEREADLLLCTDTDSQAYTVALTPEEYLKNLVPKTLLWPSFQVKKEKDRDNLVINFSAMSASDLTEHLKTLMINAKVLPFKQVVDLIPDVNHVKLLSSLQQTSILVQGCWVVKSDILYPKESVSSKTGINAEILIRTRDYVLWCYTKSRFLTRSEVLSVVKVPNEDITDIISQFSKKVYNKGWEFKYPYDEEFIENNPQIARRQEMHWDMRYKHLVRELQLGQSTAEGTVSKKTLPPPPRPHQRRHLKYRESISDDTEESGTEGGSEKMDIDNYSPKKDSYNKKHYSPRKRHGSSPMKNCPKFKNLHITSPSKPLDVLPTSEVKTILIDYVKEAICGRFCLTLHEFKESLNNTALAQAVNRSDIDLILEETLLESGAQRLQNKWPQNTKPEPLFAFTNYGNRLDRYRGALLDIFSSVARARPDILLKKIEEEFGEIISDTDCRQLFEEYCIYKAGCYYLKGTVSAES